jgi:hypothetical protein
LVQVVDARGVGPDGVVERAVDDGASGRARDVHGLLTRIARRSILRDRDPEGRTECDDNDDGSRKPHWISDRPLSKTRTITETRSQLGSLRRLRA